MGSTVRNRARAEERFAARSAILWPSATRRSRRRRIGGVRGTAGHGSPPRANMPAGSGSNAAAHARARRTVPHGGRGRHVARDPAWHLSERRPPADARRCGRRIRTVVLDDVGGAAPGAPGSWRVAAARHLWRGRVRPGPGGIPPPDAGELRVATTTERPGRSPSSRRQRSSTPGAGWGPRRAAAPRPTRTPNHGLDRPRLCGVAARQRRVAGYLGRHLSPWKRRSGFARSRAPDGTTRTASNLRTASAHWRPAGGCVVVEMGCGEDGSPAAGATSTC